MHRKGAINPTQVRQKIVQVSIVLLCKRTHHGLINFQGNPAPPILVFKVIGYIMSAETLKFNWEPAKTTEQIWNKGYNDKKWNKEINLQIHETHFGVIAGQAEVHFDVIGGINVARSKHPFVHVVAHQARQCILEDLLRVLRQSKLIRTKLIAGSFPKSPCSRSTGLQSKGGCYDETHLWPSQLACEGRMPSLWTGRMPCSR